MSSIAIKKRIKMERKTGNRCGKDLVMMIIGK